jgi:hypothetical protein
VQEFYGDFMVNDAHHFTIPVTGNELLINPKGAVANTGVSE